MSDYPMLISNKLHSFRNFAMQTYNKYLINRVAKRKRIQRAFLYSANTMQI